MKNPTEDTLPLWPDLEIKKPALNVRLLPPESIAGLYRSEAHNYFGHYPGPSGRAPMLAETRVDLVAGQGIVGDRFFGYKKNYSGQVTFFAAEIWERLGAELDCPARGPEVFRRNVITRGVDLRSLIGQTFEVQAVRFYGVVHCTPCFWMNEAFAPGALAKLTAWEGGGLRAKVLTDGALSVHERKESSCSAS
jgi:hypothetical protein